MHKVKISLSDRHLGLLWYLSSLLLNPFPESLHFGEWRGAKSQLFVGFSPEGTTHSTRNLKTCSLCKMHYFQNLILPCGFLICGEIEWTALEHLHDASFSKAPSGSVWHSKHTMQCYVSSMSQVPNKASQTRLHLKKPLRVKGWNIKQIFMPFYLKCTFPVKKKKHALEKLMTSIWNSINRGTLTQQRGWKTHC